MREREREEREKQGRGEVEMMLRYWPLGRLGKLHAFKLRQAAGAGSTGQILLPLSESCAFPIMNLMTDCANDLLGAVGGMSLGGSLAVQSIQYIHTYSLKVLVCSVALIDLHTTRPSGSV